MKVVSLIVMETGSRWPGHVRDSENIVTVGHGAETLLQMTRRTLALLDRRGQTVRVAVLACSQAIDATAVAHRGHVARTLLDAVAAATSGRLVLTSANGSPEQRRELLSLAGSLSHIAPGAVVRVTFSDAAPQDWMAGKHADVAKVGLRERETSAPSEALGTRQQRLG